MSSQLIQVLDDQSAERLVGGAKGGQNAGDGGAKTSSITLTGDWELISSGKQAGKYTLETYDYNTGLFGTIVVSANSDNLATVRGVSTATSFMVDDTGDDPLIGSDGLADRDAFNQPLF